MNKNILSITRQFTIRKRLIYTKNSKAPSPYFLSKILGLTHKKCSNILEKHKELTRVDEDYILNTVNTLKSLNINIADIEKKPMVLYTNSITLQNRYIALDECGCKPITLSILTKYVTVMNKEIATLKLNKIIPCDTNVQEILEKCFFVNDQIEIKLDKQMNENTVPLKDLRALILSRYLTKKLNMNTADLDRQWKTYSRIRHKSFKSIIDMINLLLNELNFKPERIIKNGYLIYGDSDNIKKMLENINTIGNVDFKEILHRRPKIMMSSYESIRKTIEHVKAFNIPEIAITKCLEILTLGPDTVLERLYDLNNVEEFHVLTSNPRILRLVHYQNKARLRLDYLNQIKVRCASLHILSCGSEAFVKFARDGTDRTKGRDVVVYISKLFEINETDIRDLLSRHPNWCHIPLVQVKQCIDWLLKQQFKYDDIYFNLHLILYPIKAIEEKLNILKKQEIYKKIDINTNFENITNKQMLTLCLYLIEYEYHFTGDGIWTEDHHTQQSESFNNLLPDFAEKYQKIYKYGKKPTVSSTDLEKVNQL